MHKILIENTNITKIVEILEDYLSVSYERDIPHTQL